MTPPRHVLASIEAAGFRVRVEGEDLVVSPGSGLTPELRDQITAHKLALVELLRVQAIAVAYLDAIGETDPDERRAYLDRIDTHPEWVPDLVRAAAALGIDHHPHQQAA